MFPPLPPIHILYENPAWLPPLVDGLQKEGFSTHLVEVDEGLLDADKIPAEGIWLNRISPSSHTRGHHGSVELTREILYWLECHDRRVVNGLNAYEFEMSKFRQDLALRRHGILTPKTVLATGREAILRASAHFSGPFITKHNQGGKGLGIHLFRDSAELALYLESENFDPGPGRKLILQEYIQPAEPFITRVELVGGRFIFAMRSSTDDGFELCPSDACQRPPSAPDVCPGEAPKSKFSRSPIMADDPLVKKYLSLCQEEGIEVAGIEFVEDASGRRFTYDINGTTNYSGVFGKQIGIDGMWELAQWIRKEVAPGRSIRAAS
jgi:hypothetical protein